MRELPRRGEAPAFSSSARRLAKRASAKRRKMRPRTGPEYSPALSPELARNWSAAAQRRCSKAPEGLELRRTRRVRIDALHHDDLTAS
ncbi:MAG: hypothetical protein A3I63_03415 [Betaproteobacteria bacterium RIFCSPLOWO2_02_FULL_66_14]|nr:MAG: hypothetical protein A3I63_03415 [Betaproteobacteria bacterium RIFCSPLOWO2_02_FULL_66_14]